MCTLLATGVLNIEIPLCVISSLARGVFMRCWESNLQGIVYLFVVIILADIKLDWHLGRDVPVIFELFRNFGLLGIWQVYGLQFFKCACMKWLKPVV